MWQGNVKEANWFIAWKEGWVPARPLQLEAITKFFDQDIKKITVSDGTHYNFKLMSGSTQSSRTYGIQDRTKDGVYRQISYIGPGNAEK